MGGAWEQGDWAGSAGPVSIWALGTSDSLKKRGHFLLSETALSGSWINMERVAVASRERDCEGERERVPTTCQHQMAEIPPPRWPVDCGLENDTSYPSVFPETVEKPAL